MSLTVRTALARVRQVLVDDPGAVIAETRSAADKRSRRFLTELKVAMGAGASFRQEVGVDVGAAGAVDRADGGIALPLRWHATGRNRLFPTFQGELEAVPSRSGRTLRLQGTYTVPLGTIGRLGDGVAGQRLADRSLVAFLGAMGRRVDAEVDRRMASVS